MKTETIALNENRNVTLTVYLQDPSKEFGNVCKRPGILVLPGGGYQMCSDREADPVALSYLQAGFHAFVLRYSVGPEVTWPMPLEDYERAMELIREKADEWNLLADKVAVIGFSAGGHLAGSAAVIAKNKPAAAILGYAALEGETVHGCLPSAPDLISRVDPNTCPCFVFATRTDNIVGVHNSLNFAAALERNGIMFENHIYAYGPHGFSVCNTSVLRPNDHIASRAYRWVSDSVEWLKDVLGEFEDGGLSTPRCGKRINDDLEAYCSVDCTMGHLMENEDARAVLAPMMQAAREKMGKRDPAQNNNSSGEKRSSGASGLGMKMTLREALGFGNVPREVVDKLDQKLRQIPNRLTME